MEKITYFIQYKVPFVPAVFFTIVAISGLWNLTREAGVSFRSYVQHYEFSDNKITILSRDTDIIGEFKAAESQLGIVSFRFQKPDRETMATVHFRIKEKGNPKWYYENTFTSNQLYTYDWYPFGFPIIKESGGKTFTFEITGASERKEDAVMLLTNRGFVVQYLLPNERLFSPIYRILLLFQQNVKETVKGTLLVYSGVIAILFMFTFFSERTPVLLKKIFMIGIIVFVFFWQLNPYKSIQSSTVSILILTIYAGAFTRLLNGTKTLMLSGLVFMLMGIYYVFEKIAVAERLAEWTYVLMIMALIIILFEINTKTKKSS